MSVSNRIEEIEKLPRVKESTARKYLENLQRKGLISKVGKGRKTKYVIVEI